MSHEEQTDTVYGVIARFGDTDSLLAAAHKVREAGYTKTDAFTPMPVHGVFEALGGKRTILAWMVFCGGLFGCLAGFFMQYAINVHVYPLNVGGRPFNSWPSFIPVTFECTILGAALTSVFGMFGLNKLPMPYHPIFNHDNFDRASQDKFFLIVEAADEKFDEQEVNSFLQSLNAENVESVAN